MAIAHGQDFIDAKNALPSDYRAVDTYEASDKWGTPQTDTEIQRLAGIIETDKALFYHELSATHKPREFSSWVDSGITANVYIIDYTKDGTTTQALGFYNYWPSTDPDNQQFKWTCKCGLEVDAMD